MPPKAVLSILEFSIMFVAKEISSNFAGEGGSGGDLKWLNIGRK